MTHTLVHYSHKPLTNARQNCKKFVEEFSAYLRDLKDQLGAELVELVTSRYGGTVPKTIAGPSGALEKNIVDVTSETET